MAYKTRIQLTNLTNETIEIESFTSCTVSRNITEMSSTFSFAIDSFDIDDIADKFGIGTEVNIWVGTEDNLVHTIAGWINQEPRTLNGFVKSVEFSGVDFSGRLQYRLITEAFQETDVGEIVAKLMKKYAPEFKTDIRTTGLQITTKYDKVFLFDVIKELAEIVGYDSYVDNQKVFRFLPSGHQTKSQRILKTNQFRRGSANFSWDASRLVNRLLVAGGNIKSREVRDVFTYDTQMNRVITVKRKPVGVDRIPAQHDYKTEYLYKSNFNTEMRGKYSPSNIVSSAYTKDTKAIKAGVFKYPTNIEEIDAITWEANITKQSLADTNTSATKPFFLEKLTSSSSYSAATGFGVYISSSKLRFFICTGDEKKQERFTLTVSESKVWDKNKKACIQCRWFGKTMEIWANGVLVASQELKKAVNLYTAYTKTSEIHLLADKQYYITDTKLSFLKRTDGELYSFYKQNEMINKVYMIYNNIPLRIGTENLQDTENYDVMMNYNEQTFEFTEEFPIKAGDKIEIIYAYEYQIMDVIENVASQHKYGLFEDKLVLSSNNREYVKAQANKHIQKYSKPVLTGSLEPFDYDYEAGELITLDIPELKLYETDIKITNIEYVSEPSKVSCRLNLESEANVSQIFANIIKRVEFLEAEKFYNEEDEIQQLDKFVAQINFEDITTIETISVDDFVIGKARFNFAEFTGVLEG